MISFQLWPFCDVRVLARPYLMMLYVIFPIHVNFPIRYRFVFKTIIHRKNIGLFYVTWDLKRLLVMMFQSWLAPVHCCPKIHKWTPEPTLSKKTHNCSECCTWLKSRLPVICLCTLGQYCTSSFLVQCCLKIVNIAFTGYFPNKHLQVIFLINIVCQPYWLTLDK